MVWLRHSLIDLREIINVFGIDMLDYIKQNKNDAEKIAEQLKKLALEIYSKKEEEITSEQMRELERVVMLKVVDEKWMNHIEIDMDNENSVEIAFSKKIKNFLKFFSNWLK